MTQSDIEDIQAFAAQRGISVLQIGVSSEALTAYNRQALVRHAVLTVPERPKVGVSHKRFPKAVQIIDLGPEAKEQA